jgi:lipopolysaccharide heptosyltransferase I
VTSVLLVRLGSLGDVVHAIPAAAALRRQYPAARIDWVVDPRYAELLSLVDGLDSVIPLDPRASIAALLRTVRDLRGARYDAVIDLQGLIKSAVLARAARGRQTVGFPASHLREPAARFFYSATGNLDRETHVIYQNLALLATVGVHDRAVRFPLRVPVSDMVARLGERATGAFALLNPGAAWPNKRWPADRFGALASRLQREAGLRSLVLWGPGERDLADRVAAASSGAARALPGTSVTDVLVLAQAARIVISGDTGPLHLAAAVSTPVVALFGPTRAERNGPWAREDVSVSRVDRCECLYERHCRRGSTPCIEEIGVDEVVEAARRRLSTHD